MLEVDVAIAGGGTVGLSLALGILANTPLSVAVVEAVPYQQGKPHPGFDARALALAKGSCDFLQQAGITDASGLGAAISHIQVSDQGHAGRCNLHHQDYHIPYLGRVVELYELGSRLQQQFAEQLKLHGDRLHWLCPDSIAQLSQSSEHNSLQLVSGEAISCRLLVVAEGGQSKTKSLLQTEQYQHDYQQTALIANVALDRPHQGWAYERFTQQGPIALLPMTPDPDSGMQRGSLVWTIPPEQQQHMLDMSDRAFLAQLQNEFGYRAGRLVAIGERHCYPLRLLQVKQPIGHRTVIIGNASQSLHPIAGQGLNLGLRDVADLLQQLQLSTTTDPGAYEVLAGYRERRKGDQQQVIDFTDGLVRLFSNDFLPAVVGRNLGLAVMNMLPGVKRQLAMQAMGYRQR